MLAVINVRNLLTNVPIRDIWKNEEKDFTPWLKENIQEIGNIIGCNLYDVELEVRVGCRFEADIVARNDDETVIIENQFNKSDHKHLGQLLTYMANLNANVLVWISEQFSEEHLMTVRMLNSITGSMYRFYAIAIKTYLINGTYAYHFGVLVEPDENVKILNDKKSNCYKKISENYLSFWEDLKPLLQDPLKNDLKIIKSGRSYSYINFPKFSIHPEFSERGKYVLVRVIVDDNDLFKKVKDHFDNNGERDFEVAKGTKKTTLNYLIWKEHFNNSKEEKITWLAETLQRVYEICKSFKL